MMKSLLMLTVAFGFVLTACQTVPAATASPILSSALEAGQTGTEPAEPDSIRPLSPTPDPKQEALILLAVQDLSLRLKIPQKQIKIIFAVPTVWPDSSLGCPILGRISAPGKITGFKIRLEAGGLEYVYHTDDTSQIILCPPEKPDEPGLR